MEVSDLDGNDLSDDSESHRRKLLSRTLKTPTSTVSFDDGFIYPLRRLAPKKVRVAFSEFEGEVDAGLVSDRKNAIINEIIEME